MTSWFNFGRKNKSKSKSNKYAFTSNGGACDGNTSASLAEALIFPMQYNGPTYNFSSFPDELLFIPFRDSSIPRHNPSNLFSQNKVNHKFGVTALLIHGNPKNNPTHFMILFHGNGVDLGMASAIWRPLIRALPIHLLIAEYPGYGIMDGRCTCKQVIKVAEHVYDFVTNPYSRGGLNISVDKLIILGRSIGTGPASHIAKRQCHTLILVSPFTSIHNLSKDLMGKWTQWMLPKDYGQVTMDENDSDLERECVDECTEYDCDNDSDGMAPNLVKSISNPVTSPKHVSYDLNKMASDDMAYTVHSPNKSSMALLRENEENKSDFYRQSHNGNDIAYFGDEFDEIAIAKPTEISQSQTWTNTDSKKEKINRAEMKRVNHKKRKRNGPSFVFNNVTQIEKWQCKNFMVFHGKNDELIPYQHTNTIVSTVHKCKPELKAKKFLIDGVGHNDVNIQFIGLRIFMQYQDELQPSFENGHSAMNIDRLVPYLDNPPQFDVMTNKVQNFNCAPKRKKASKFKIKRVIQESVPSLFDSDDSLNGENGNGDGDGVRVQFINEWNENKGEFNGFRRDLPSKVYDLSLKLKLDAQEKQMQKANDVIATKWI